MSGQSTKAHGFTMAPSVRTRLHLVSSHTAHQQLGRVHHASAVQRISSMASRMARMGNPGVPLLLAPLKLLFGFSLQFILLLETVANGCQERLQEGEKILLGDSRLPIQEEEQLTLHEVYLGEGEAEAVEPLDGRVPGPVLVLGTGVVEVLGCEDEGSQEDSVDGAAHALGHRRQTSS